ncbi:MAG: type II toxin-antitoxin system VapC family toxin [Acidobacteria bacterium]|nr:type II toxin-antitoxin system VapC family toxin [Acidobacteriota bacterium]
MLDAIADGATVEVPALWPLEVANALVVLVRRRKLSEAERRAALSWLQKLRLRMDHDGSGLAFARLGELATAHHLSVYDATYLDLAQRRALPLACQDGPLATAARTLELPLWRAPHQAPPSPAP